jgi:hypothetical protein
MPGNSNLSGFIFENHALIHGLITPASTFVIVEGLQGRSFPTRSGDYWFM